MEETAKDWVARPDEADLDRGSIARWFVAQLAESLQLECPPAGKPAPPPPPRSPPAPAAATPADTPEVIVVEDDPALAGLLEYGLRARGYRFVTFRNGRDALDALLALDVGDGHPLLLLDVDLPALDGYSILDALTRERPGRYRVVFTTVHGDESEQLRGLEAGALDYLVKPISLRVALEKIRRWVGR
jgi:CheY-like chemotaxis protein